MLLVLGQNQLWSEKESQRKHPAEHLDFCPQSHWHCRSQYRHNELCQILSPSFSCLPLWHTVDGYQIRSGDYSDKQDRSPEKKYFRKKIACVCAVMFEKRKVCQKIVPLACGTVLWAISECILGVAQQVLNRKCCLWMLCEKTEFLLDGTEKDMHNDLPLPHGFQNIAK